MIETQMQQENGITMLLHKYSEQEALRTQREHGVEYLKTIGVSSPSIAIVEACYVRQNLISSSTPREALNMRDLPPVITQLVRTALEQAQGKTDIKTELTTVKGILETVRTEDEASSYGVENFNVSELDAFLNPLIEKIGYALEYTQ